MGIQYGNLTLHGVNQEELLNCLNEIGRNAYISPTVNQFTTIYDRTVGGLLQEDIADLIELDLRNKDIIKQYRYPPCSALVCLANYLSARFSCSALAVYVYDGSIFWYHLNQCGEMLDEYITCGDNNWKPGKGFYDLPANCQIKGGNARKLCSTFKREDSFEQVEAILRETDSSPVYRHEILAKTLGIYPGLVAGLNYIAVDTGEFADFWEAFSDEEDVPSFEEISLMLKKTKMQELP
ncbi:MAG: hypothetical protein ACRC80_03240 [Waterburya sp.]